MTYNKLRLGAYGIILLLSFALVVYGQTISGSLSGHVYDAQMAPIQGATVTITDSSRNFTVGTKTGMEGNFLSAGLAPGNYSVAVEAPGFKKFSQTGIPLNANDKLDVGSLRLEIGAVTESIEVSSQAALLKTESVELSGTVTGRQIEN